MIYLLKDTKVVVMIGATVVKEAIRQQLQYLCDAVSDQDEFIVSSLRENLEMQLELVNCRSAAATALGHTIASVEVDSEVPLYEKGHSQILIPQLFLATCQGENLFMVAKGALEERQGEMIK